MYLWSQPFVPELVGRTLIIRRCRNREEGMGNSGASAPRRGDFE